MGTTEAGFGGKAEIVRRVLLPDDVRVIGPYVEWSGAPASDARPWPDWSNGFRFAEVSSSTCLRQFARLAKAAADTEVTKFVCNFGPLVLSGGRPCTEDLNVPIGHWTHNGVTLSDPYLRRYRPPRPRFRLSS